MSRIFVDHFIYQNRSYDCYYDTGNNTGVVQSTGQGEQLNYIAIPNSGRGSSNGDFIRQFCSDNPATTLVKCYASPNSPFFTWTLEANSVTCQVSPGGCDAVINSLNVSNETQQGGNDGQVVVNASSSAGGLQYSLDGVTYQSGNTFTGLAPNTYTAYIQDAAGCTSSQAFTVQPYNNPIQNFAGSLPVVDLGNGNISRWSAAFNPIVINYQRKDFVVTSVTQYSSTQLLVQVQNGLTGTQYQAAINDGVYIKTDKYEFFGKADAYNNGLIITAQYFTDDLNPGFLNIPVLKQNFYTETEITTGINPVKKVLVAKHSPNLKGATKADLAAYLQTLLPLQDGYDYLAAVYREINKAGSYTVRYREVWDGGNTNWYSAPYALYFTYSAMQLQELYGGNMAEYVTFLGGVRRAKWLTDMQQPTLWRGLPYEVAFIYSEYLLGKDIYLQVQPNDTSAIEGKLLNADNAYIINPDTSRILIERVNNAGYPVKANLGVNRILIPQQGLAASTSAVINLYYFDDNGIKVFIMQPLTIKVEPACNDPYVYLKWINHLGGWDYWRFGYNQALSSSASGSQQISRYVLDWANGDTIEDYISRNANEKLTLYAGGVDANSLRGLRWMNNSIRTMMLTNLQPYQWQTVIVPDGDFSAWNTRQAGADVEIKLTLPGRNIQGQ